MDFAAGHALKSRPLARDRPIAAQTRARSAARPFCESTVLKELDGATAPEHVWHSSNPRTPG